MKSRDNSAAAAIFAILFLLVLLPLLAVLFQILCPGMKQENFDLKNLGLIREIMTRPLWRRAFLDSLALASGTTALGLVLASVLAHIRVHYVFPGSKFMDLAAWILMIIPSFILAQGWVYFASGNGIAKSWFSISWMNSFVFSFPGLVTVMSLCKFPMAYITIRTAMEWYPQRLMHAARMNGASAFRAWRDVQLPLSIPAYCSAAMLIFMDTVGDYGLSSTITAVYSFPTLPYTIYSAICQTPVRFDMAGVLSLGLMILIVVAMIIQNAALGHRHYDYLDNGTVQTQARPVSKPAAVALSIVNWAMIVIALGIPLGSNLIMSFSSSVSIRRFTFTLENYQAVFSSTSSLLPGIRHSLTIAAIAAVIGLGIAFCTSYVLTYSHSHLKKAIDMSTLIAMAVPGVVLGIGYIFVWNQNWLKPLGLHLYGTPAILVLGSTASAIPLINRVLVSGMAKVPGSLLTAAQMQGAGFVRKMKTILIPLIYSSVVSAVLSAFGGSIFNLAITTILYPPGFATLPVYISDSYNDLQFGYAAAATIASGACIIAIMYAMQAVLNHFWKKRRNLRHADS